ncbi:aldo/keto reductase [Vallitalea okinawensis]|uniref:aldo/keto reductase n=1 Tax=Vallitalea okinawensis TaxID=2078660 RepID=UPI000CFAA166|nr:aldo/keto reductase [Vallitalea okinawensis]
MQPLGEKVILNNGVKMPSFGLGTFKVTDEKECIQAVSYALDIGYRHIDTASIYGNELAVGKGIKESSVKREDIFLVSKLWNSDQGYDSTLRAFEKTLKKLDTDYLDMYLIHWPKPFNIETWKAMERLYDEKVIKVLGVSNFKMYHLEDLMAYTNIKPAVNQVEYHPWFIQKEVHEFCQLHKIQLEAWGPLMQGKIFDIPLMKELSEKYNKTIAQIALRWDLQMGVVTIPKSTRPERIKSNAEIYDFVISDEDMKRIGELNISKRIGPDPDSINF